MYNFKGKNCFVTGGARGIGQAVVSAFHRAGANVAFCDIDVEGGEKLASSLSGTQFYPLDVKDERLLLSAMERVYKAWGDIDIIVNNVGISQFSSLVDTSIADFDAILAVNLRPVFITSREMALRRNTLEGKARYGRIINIASTRYLQSEPGSEGYAASKGGIVSLTHALAVSLSAYRITVNAISPGWIDTGHYGELRPEDHAQHPSGRVGRVEDIANACLFLASPENDFMNGQNIVIDGGMTKKMIYFE